MHSPVGRNAQYCAYVFGVYRVAEFNKKAGWFLCNGVWLTHFDISKVKVISKLLCIWHSYVNLECFNSEDIDFMTEFMCTKQLSNHSVSYAEARNRYRLDVSPSVCYTLALHQNGPTYCHDFFTTR